MNEISPESFALLCFLALMQNNGGMVEKSPDYIAEKTTMLKMGYNAFAWLDIKNMGRVMNWFYTWDVKVPEIIEEEWRLQQEAARRFI